jgi:hypothetical protein
MDMSNGYFAVCPACEGHGGFDRLGGFTAADMDEWYGDDFYERETFVSDYVGGVYSDPCEVCNGDRVVKSADLPRIEAELADAAEAEYERRMESRYAGW